MNKFLRKTLIPVAMVTALAGVLVGCGGGASGGGNNEGAGSGSGGTQQLAKPVSSIGQIDGFGSVIVNGVHYNTDNAVIVMNGVEVPEAELKVGYIVRVTATVDENGEAIATRVEYSAEVIGPVESVDIAGGTITVLGQIVRISEDTFFDDDIDENDLEQMLLNAVIEVSAFISEDGTLFAAHIEIELEEQHFRLEGSISNVNSEEFSFHINGQEIDVSDVDLGDLSIEELSDGMHVVVTGSLEDGIFIVDEEFEENGQWFEYEENSDVEIEGFVSELTDNGSFEIHGIRINVVETTEFEHGNLENLRSGALVEVEGVFNDDDVIIAREIRFERESEMEFEGDIQAIDLQNNTFTIHDIIFTVDTNTSFDDDSEMEERRFALDDLSIGDSLHVLAFTDFDDEDVLLAKRIRRHASDHEEEFRAEAMGRIVAVEGELVELHNGIVIAIGEQTEIFGGDLRLDTPLEVLGAAIAVVGSFDGDILYASGITILAWCSDDGSVLSIGDDEVSLSVLVFCEHLRNEHEEFDDDEFDEEEFDSHDFNEGELDEDEFDNHDFDEGELDEEEFDNHDVDEEEFDEDEFDNHDFDEGELDEEEFNNGETDGDEGNSDSEHEGEVVDESDEEDGNTEEGEGSAGESDDGEVDESEGESVEENDTEHTDEHTEANESEEGDGEHGGEDESEEV